MLLATQQQLAASGDNASELLRRMVAGTNSADQPSSSDQLPK